MAEVVVEQGTPPTTGDSAFSGMSGVWAWVKQYWIVLAIAALLIIAVVVGIWLYLWWKKQQKREDEMYLLWERTVDSCEKCSKHQWIGKGWRWWIVLVFGTPLALLFVYLYLFPGRGEHIYLLIACFLSGFLLVLPFARIFYVEHSRPVIDSYQRTVGYYRGHTRRMDGYVYLLMKVGKRWLVFDDVVCLQLPEDVRTIKITKAKRERDGETVEIQQHEFEQVELTNAYILEDNKPYIFIPMVAYVAENNYFYSPTLVENGRIIDLRQQIANSYHLQSGIQHMETLYSGLSKVTSGALDSSLVVGALKKTPQKERDVDNGAGNDGNNS